jgi:threonylcarbamoyladenosine tRNA methylthiotransferase MtaB
MNNDRVPLRASIHTLGCRLNQAESSLLAEKLAEAGYVLVPFGEAADLGIIHTCTVTGEADAKSRKLIRQFVRKNPEAYTAVIGCYAQLGSDVLAELDGVDLIVGNQEKLNVLAYVAAGKNDKPLVIRDRMNRDEFSIDFAGQGPRLTQRANLKIQDGCNRMCRYCLIPFARGRERSRNLDNLVDEARGLVARGAKEIVLSGVNIGAYHSEAGTLVDVVERLNALDGLNRIRIGSLEPGTIPEIFFSYMAEVDHALVPFLHIPLQSGSNRVLEAMGRPGTREAFLAFLDKARAAVPGIGLGTDLMTGFPGETEADFEDSCTVLQDSPLFYSHVFKYSERPGTASVRIEPKVSSQIATERAAVLRRISAQKNQAFLELQQDKIVDVLIEEKENGYWSGYTGNYLRVALKEEESDLTNTMVSVRITHTTADCAYGVGCADEAKTICNAAFVCTLDSNALKWK